MADTDLRQITRDSLFVMAGLRIAGRDKEFRVKVRNLSARGLMAEGELRVVPGMPIAVEVRNVGWVEGTVAWIQDSRFGVAFNEEIDPKAARGSLSPAQDGQADYFTRRSLASAMRGLQPSPHQLRKI